MLANEHDYTRFVPIISSLPNAVIQKYVDQMFSLLQSEKDDIYKSAEHLIIKLAAKGRIPEAKVELLFSWLLSENYHNQRMALKLLPSVVCANRLAKERVDDVIAMIESDDSEIANLATFLLCEWCTTSRQVPGRHTYLELNTKQVERILLLLESEQKGVRENAIYILACIFDYSNSTYLDKVSNLLADPSSDSDVKSAVLEFLRILDDKLPPEHRQSIIKPFI